MTVNEIRDAREALENKILRLCEEFRSETGFAVTGCDIKTTTVHSVGEKYPRRVNTGVVVELESI